MFLSILRRSRRSAASLFRQPPSSTHAPLKHASSSSSRDIMTSNLFSMLSRDAQFPNPKPFVSCFFPGVCFAFKSFCSKFSSASFTTLHQLPELASSRNSSKYRALMESLRKYGKCYYELSKARLSFLVMSTAAAGFALGSEETIDFAKLCWTSIGTMMASASANTFNQIIETKNDGAMKRTMLRPLPSGRISRVHAFSWGAAMGVSGIYILMTRTNELTAALGAGNLALYVLGYTPLKQIHFLNTWVGAVVGAIPPLMGWTSATGKLELQAYVLAGALYFWQLPHFMSLAWLCKKDYSAGGFKMLSLVDKTGKRTAAVALRNCFYLLPLGYLAVNSGLTSDVFAYENLALTASMALPAFSFYRNPNSQSARMLFRSSLLYLSGLMIMMIIHRKPYSVQSSDEVSWVSLPIMSILGDCTGPEEVRDFSKPEALIGLSVLNSKDRYEANRIEAKPPIAFLSAAPFPFLPVPEY